MGPRLPAAASPHLFFKESAMKRFVILLALFVLLPVTASADPPS